MDTVVMLVVFAILASLALLVPFPLTDKANPSDTSFVPVPEWYFLRLRLSELNFDLVPRPQSDPAPNPHYS